MIRGLAVVVQLSTFCLIVTAGTPHLITSKELELGGSVTFSCSVPEDGGRFLHWYKQSLGRTIETVASVVYNKIKQFEPFINSRFQVQFSNSQWNLSINSIKKEDEAIYFCQEGNEYLQTYINGFYLTVEDNSQQTAVYVKQTPDTAAAPLGESVTLQCSLLSQNKETRLQCPVNHHVHWFKSGSGKSTPSIIYTQSNGTDEDERRSCVYRLSKTLQNSSDAGIYYCAVVTCGEILFGKGTNVETSQEKELIPGAVLVLGGLLVCCVVVIFFLLSFLNQRRASDLCKATSTCCRAGHHRSSENLSNNLDTETQVVNYAALDFPTRKVKDGKKKRIDHTQVTYSSVQTGSENTQQLSL